MRFWTVCRPLEWSRPPSPMTATALLDIEACPLRWSLRHARYAEVRREKGYPPGTRFALGGLAVHRVLERIGREMQNQSKGEVGSGDGMAALIGILRRL